MKEKTITLVKLVSVIYIILIIVIIINAIINTGLFRDISKQSEKISETEEISKVATVYPVSSLLNIIASTKPSNTSDSIYISNPSKVLSCNYFIIT